jgi:hypothetical protein
VVQGRLRPELDEVQDEVSNRHRTWSRRLWLALVRHATGSLRVRPPLVDAPVGVCVVCAGKACAVWVVVVSSTLTRALFSSSFFSVFFGKTTPKIKSGQEVASLRMENHAAVDVMRTTSQTSFSLAASQEQAQLASTVARQALADERAKGA